MNALTAHADQLGDFCSTKQVLVHGHAKVGTTYLDEPQEGQSVSDLLVRRTTYFDQIGLLTPAVRVTSPHLPRRLFLELEEPDHTVSAVGYINPKIVVVFALPNTPIPAATWRRGKYLFIGCREGLVWPEFRREAAAILRPGEMALIGRCLDEAAPAALPNDLNQFRMPAGFHLSVDCEATPVLAKRLA